MNQDIIVLFIVIITVGYILYSIKKSLKKEGNKSNCGGCSGCALSKKDNAKSCV